MSTVLISNICKARYWILLSFSAGVMTYTAAEMLGQANETTGMASAIGGFVIGLLFILIIERSLPHFHYHIKKTKLPNSKKKAALIVGTIAIHNIPEGFAIAAAFAGSGPLGWFTTISMAIQDAPEGALISAPLICYGLKKEKAIFFGILSGVAESLAAIVGYVFLSIITGLIPLALAFSAGAMIYVVGVEIMPGVLREKLYLGSASFIAGMATAVALSGFLS
jgi:ZIP family zinc transporter